MVKWKKIKTFSLAAKVDFALQENCKKAIEKFCPVSSSVSIVDCLRRKLLDPGLGQMCRRVVINRIMTQNKDIRLNPSLYNACTRDISAFCAEPFLVLGQKTTDQPTNGQVILWKSSKIFFSLFIGLYIGKHAYSHHFFFEL